MCDSAVRINKEQMMKTLGNKYKFPGTQIKWEIWEFYVSQP